jgi:hypothetical protein
MRNQRQSNSGGPNHQVGEHHLALRFREFLPCARGWLEHPLRLIRARPSDPREWCCVLARTGADWGDRTRWPDRPRWFARASRNHALKFEATITIS